MQESYGEGVASHTGSESCVAARKDGGEALTGVRAGRPLNREMLDPPRGGHFGVPHDGRHGGTPTGVIEGYSLRSATSGSTFVARRAGT